MSHGAMVRESTGFLGSPSAAVLSLPLLLLLSSVSTTHASVCRHPVEPENGGYSCHPSPCRTLSEGTVIEFFCDEGYVMKGDYRYLTCTSGEWNTLTQVRCLPSQEKEPEPVFGMNTVSLVTTTASSVALVLLLVVLFVLLQPKLKSFHHTRRDEEVGGQPVSIMVDGVQVALPSYEEAVAGSGSMGSSLTAPPPPADQGAHGPSAAPQQQQAEPLAPGQHAELAMVHRVPSPSSPPSSSSSSSSSSSLAMLGATAVTGLHRGERPSSTHSEPHSLLLEPSELDFTDDIPLLKEA
ncbi:sushi domain-containing protein 6-like [Alosa sapidissima]|uniref:sushi domain-containing protein 6-like n=1 Tax=Alosa sapidissima TaxID=34773 RepID=UPI001C08C90A|nr:sushi domain-containing protein 6-like [Alosa sapidissima]